MNLQDIIREEMNIAMTDAEQRIQLRVAQFLVGGGSISDSIKALPPSRSGTKLLGKVQKPKIQKLIISNPEKSAREVWLFLKKNPWSTMIDVKSHFGWKGSLHTDAGYHKMKKILNLHTKSKGKATKLIYQAVGEGP